MSTSASRRKAAGQQQQSTTTRKGRQQQQQQQSSSSSSSEDDMPMSTPVRPPRGGRNAATSTTAGNKKNNKTPHGYCETPDDANIHNTEHLLAQKQTPRTPTHVQRMMQQHEPTHRPLVEAEALQITELCAFKVDHTAYNSYLYTGKMKIPKVSSIAREDYASSIGARSGKNIRVYPQTTRRSTRLTAEHEKYNPPDAFDYNFDSDDDDDDDVENANSFNINTTSHTTRRGNSGANLNAHQTILSSHAYKNVHSSANIVNNPHHAVDDNSDEWEFGLDSEYGVEDEDEDDEDEDDEDEDDEDEDEDEEDESDATYHNDTMGDDSEVTPVKPRRGRPTKQEQLKKKQQQQEEEQKQKTTTRQTKQSVLSQTNKRGQQVTTTNTKSVKKTTTNTKQQKQQTTRRGRKTMGETDDDNDDNDDDDDDNDDDEEEEHSDNDNMTEVTPVARRTRRGAAQSTQKKPTTQQHKHKQQQQQQQQQQPKPRYSSRPPPDNNNFNNNNNNNSNSNNTFNHNNTTTPELEYNIVPIVVKYPLMGSLSDWKDSFQTCQEEVVLYRQIETWKCPFLLRYYGTHGPGLVFEFVDGESLDTYLFHSTDIDREAHTWMWSELGLHICTALLYLHKLNISHNDIKPENVRYSATKRCWKLLDLGLATDFDMKVSRQIGTNGYRAPEVATTGYLNRRSDVYGLGVMMDDALESIVQRYQVLEDIYDEYSDVMQQYREEKRTKAYKQRGGEIDLDEEIKQILLSHVKRRRVDSLPINTENCQYIVQQSQRYVSFLETARCVVKQTLAEDAEKRPSVKRLLLCFRELVPLENELRFALSRLRAMGVW